MIGFLIAGVPAAVLLGFATFFLSMIPIGPPLIWGGAAAWLYSEGRPAGLFSWCCTACSSSAASTISSNPS
jgi:predicted PurR-regulated permease PerM